MMSLSSYSQLSYYGLTSSLDTAQGATFKFVTSWEFTTYITEMAMLTETY